MKTIETIYFDNAATTKPSPEALQKTLDLLQNGYGNPSSLHKMGFDAEMEIVRARKDLANILQVSPDEIYFTSGGTESNNLAILGIAAAYARKGRHIISTAIEHPSLTEPLKHLESNGFEVSFLPVDEKGTVHLSVLEKTIRDDTILVAVGHVNSEVGTVQNIAAMGELLANKNIIFHVDGVQSFGKFDLNLRRIRAGAFSASGHKIHGIKGAGLLYIDKNIKISPLFFGGGQEKNIRPGTENVPAIAAFSVAARQFVSQQKGNFTHVKEIRDYIASHISSIADINGEDGNFASPYILNASFRHVKGETLLHMLEEKNIFVSTGSACSSKKKKNEVLAAMKKNTDWGACRFSFSKYNTLEEAKYFISSLTECLNTLRRVHP